MKESNNRIEEIKNDHAGFIDDKFHKGESRLNFQILIIYWECSSILLELMIMRRKENVMRKILSKSLVSLLILIIVLILASCGNKTTSNSKEDALSKLNAAMEKGSKNTYIDMDMDGTIEGSLLKGETVEFKMNVKSKASEPGKFDIKKHQAAMDINMTVKNQSIAGKSYIKDGYTYTDMMNRKVKVKLSKAMGSFMNPTNMSNFSQLNKLDKEYVKNVSADGDKITVSLDYPKFFNSYFADAFKSVDKEKMKETLKSIKTFKMIFTVKEDEIKAVGMIFEMSIGDKDMKMKMNCKYNKFAKDGKISFPSDLKSYPLVTTPSGSSPFGI